MPHFGPNPLLTELRPMVWAFIPYRIDGDRLIAEGYDTEQTKFELAEAFRQLALPWLWQPITANGLADVMQQVLVLSERQPVVVFNFCDGAGLDGNPGLSVVQALESSGVPFTGALSAFYHISTSKLAMKERFVQAGVQTAPFEPLPPTGPVCGICQRIGSPVIIKPDVSAASFGIGLRSVVSGDELVAAQRDELRFGKSAPTFVDVPIFAERFIEGAEFTVLVFGESDGPTPLECLPPVERIFHRAIPLHERFLSYDRYWGYFEEESRPSPHEPFYRYEPAPPDLVDALTALALDAYRAVEGSGYGRVDIRRDVANGQLYVLEVNANCGLSSDRETTAGEILRLARVPFHELLATLAEGALHRARPRKGKS